MVLKGELEYLRKILKYMFVLYEMYNRVVFLFCVRSVLNYIKY